MAMASMHAVGDGNGRVFFGCGTGVGESFFFIELLGFVRKLLPLDMRGP